MPQENRQDFGLSPLRRCAGRLSAAVLAYSLATCPAATLACGYHDPAALSLGILNWVYPEALHVRTAVWQAEDAGLLPPRKAVADANLFAFHRAVSDMHALAARLAATPQPGDSERGIAIVLLDSVMWTRFAAGEGGLVVKAHVHGPLQNDVVVVTDGKVVRAMLAGTLRFPQAEAHGLVRLYGEAAGQEAVRARFAAIDRTPARTAKRPLERRPVGSAQEGAE